MSVEISELVRIHANLLKMLYRRDPIKRSGKRRWSGKLLDSSELKKEFEYPSNFEELETRLEEIKTKNLSIYAHENIGSLDDILTSLSGIYGEDHLVVFMTDLNSKEATECLRLSQEEYSTKQIIAIYVGTRTNPSKPLIDKMVESLDISFETFSKAQMLIDPISSIRVPRHRLVSSLEERSSILRSLSIKDFNPDAGDDPINFMPALRPDDVIRKYYNFPMGGLIEIIRNTSSGPSIYYRIVGIKKSEPKPLVPPKEKKVHQGNRKFTNYVSPTEYAMAITKTVAGLVKTPPPDKYLQQPERRILKIAEKMVKNKEADVVFERSHIEDPSVVEHLHLSEGILPHV